MMIQRIANMQIIAFEHLLQNNSTDRHDGKLKSSGDDPFSTYTKFFEKLLFLTPDTYLPNGGPPREDSED